MSRSEAFRSIIGEPMSFDETWIETTSYSEDKRTLWVVRVGSRIVKVGETFDDVSGALAFDAATDWARREKLDGEAASYDWKHHVVSANSSVATK